MLASIDGIASFISIPLVGGGGWVAAHLVGNRSSAIETFGQETGTF